MTQLNFCVCRVREKKVIKILFFERLTLNLIWKYSFYKIKKNYIPLYRNTQQYATLNCSVKASLRAGGL